REKELVKRKVFIEMDLLLGKYFLT
ncbi:hypothetical protein HKBW3S06_01477, partial [Candidatus Hakubella thermalkaliphila]